MATPATINTIDPDIDLDPPQILKRGLPDRRILLAALFVAEHIDGAWRQRQSDGAGHGWAFDVAVEYNAVPEGWSFGLSGMGSHWPEYTGIRFTPGELHAVVQLARHMIAREQAEAAAEDNTEAGS